jgi:hypothetical protein
MRKEVCLPGNICRCAMSPVPGWILETHFTQIAIGSFAFRQLTLLLRLYACTPSRKSHPVVVSSGYVAHTENAGALQCQLSVTVG